METKYNLLTRLLKNIKNVVNPDGSVAGSGGVLVVHEVTNTLLNGVLPNIDGYEFTQGISGESDSRFSFPLDIGELSLADIIVLISGKKVNYDHLNYENGKLEISMGSATASESVITGLTITITSKGVLDHTYAEIKAAPLSVIHANEEDEAHVYYANRFYHYNDLFFINADGEGYACETEADYPYHLYEPLGEDSGPIE